MRPPHVVFVVRGICGKHPAQVPLPEDQHPVGELGSDGQHDAFGEAVSPRAARRDLDYIDARIRQHRVERGRELTGPIPDEEPVPGNTLAEVRHEIAGLLGRVGAENPVTSCTCRYSCTRPTHSTRSQCTDGRAGPRRSTRWAAQAAGQSQ
jgi:hypothetical protein